MRQHGGHLRQRLLAAEHFLRLNEVLASLLQVLPQPHHFALQLVIGNFQRGRRFGERGKGMLQEFTCFGEGGWGRELCDGVGHESLG